MPAPTPIHIVIRALLFVALAIVGDGMARAADDAQPQAPRPQRSDPRSKISSALRPYLGQPGPVAAIAPTLRALTVATARPELISLRLDVPPTAANLAAIRATGAGVTAVSARWNVVKVDATLAQADALALLPEVQAVVMARPPRPHAQPGTYTNQAGAVIRSDQINTVNGITGSGRTVGLISDSLNLSPAVGSGTTTGSAPATLTNTTPQQAGNLPASITVVDFGSAGNGHTDEGEAMMEECYHLAPGAAYAFASAGGVQTDMATNIAKLKTLAGCHIICDDVGFFDEPMFQDGPIAQAVDAFVQGGGVYLSAAGNSADQGILTTYLDVSATADPHTGTVADGDDFHDWGLGGSTPSFLAIDITGNRPTVFVTLQWNQPYHSYGLGSGAQTDFDLYLFQTAAANGTILASSTDGQGTVASPSGDPLEILQYHSNVNGTKRVYLAIDRFGGATAAVMRVVVDVNGGTVSSAGFGFGTVYGHPAAQSALAIAAVPYGSPNQLEFFSAKGGWGSGGLPFYFSTTGAALGGAPQLRNKPDLTAPDGVTTSVNFVPFYGTSAATPNAAAAAALLWSAQPGLSNVAVVAALRAGAVDITASPAAAGSDAWSGAGRVDVVASFATLSDAVTMSGSPSLSDLPSSTFTITFASAVTGLTAGMFQITNGTAGSLSGSGAVYTLPVTASAPGTVTASLAAGTINDVHGIANGAASASVTYDTTAPLLTITPAQSTVVAGQPLAFTFTFSEAVTGFSASAVTVTNGQAAAPTGSGAVYTMQITAAQAGTLTVSVAAGAVVDLAGNGLGAAASAQATVTAAPLLTITPAQSTVVAGQLLAFTFTFSEAVTGFSASAVTVTNGQAAAPTGSGAVYTMQVTAAQAGTLTVSVAAGAVVDLAGNGLGAAASAQATVTAAPVVAQSSGSKKHCGGSSFFGFLWLSGLLWWRRRGLRDA